MSLLSLLFNRAIKIAPVYPIRDNNEPIVPVGDMDTDTDCSTEYDDTEVRTFDPDLEPGDYYLQKIRRNMGHTEDLEDKDLEDKDLEDEYLEEKRSEEIINIEDVEPDVHVNRLYYIYNERFANIRFIDSLV